MINQLRTKSIVFGIVFMLFFMAVHVSAAAQTTVITNEVVTKSIFGLQSLIVVEWDANKAKQPLEPGYALFIPINVTFWIIGGPFSQIILSYYNLTNQFITVSLEIEDIPSWCTADLQYSKLQFPITDTRTTQHTSLMVVFDYTAPAFEPLYLKLRASSDDKRGPFGVLPLIKGCEVTPEIGVVPGYVPLIDITLENNSFETTPGTPVVVPITVQNLGNGDTTVNVNITDIPQGWDFLLDPLQLELAVNESKIMNLTIYPPIVYYVSQTITISFTPFSSKYPTYQGLPHYVQIRVDVKP